MSSFLSHCVLAKQTAKRISWAITDIQVRDHSLRDPLQGPLCSRRETNHSWGMKDTTRVAVASGPIAGSETRPQAAGTCRTQRHDHMAALATCRCPAQGRTLPTPTDSAQRKGWKQNRNNSRKASVPALRGLGVVSCRHRWTPAVHVPPAHQTLLGARTAGTSRGRAWLWDLGLSQDHGVRLGWEDVHAHRVKVLPGSRCGRGGGWDGTLSGEGFPEAFAGTA